MRALVGLMAGLLLLGWTSDAAAFCRMTTSRRDLLPGERCVGDGVPLAWSRRCMSYGVDERGSGGDLPVADIQRIVRASFDTWLAVTCDGAAPGFEVEETAELSTCQEAEFNRTGGNVNTVAFLDAWPSTYEPGAFAVTTVWHSRSTGQIYDADIQLNQRLGPYVEREPTTCPGPGEPEHPTVDLQNVLTHEIGHFFGIGHSEMVNVTMSAVSCRGETSKRILRSDDIEALCTVYPPGALPETCDFKPTGGLKLDCERAGGRGCALTAPPVASGPAVWLTLLGGALLLARRRRR